MVSNQTAKDQLDDFPEVWEHYFATRDSKTRNKIVECYMPLARSLAAHYFKSRVGGQTDYNDYLHLAILGLIQAIEKFKPNQGAKFTTYASYRIKGQILNSISAFSEKNSQLNFAAQRKKELLNSLASCEEEECKERTDFEAITNFTLNVTYNLLISESLKDEEVEQVTELDAYSSFELDDIVRTIRKLVDLIPAKHKVVLEYYYHYELNYSEIAELIGVTKGRVSQLHKQAIEELRILYKEAHELNAVF